MSDKAKFTVTAPSCMEEWDQIIAASPQGTLFSESQYLNACGRDFGLFVIHQGRQVKGALCLVYGDNRTTCELDDLVIHNGLMFVPDYTKKQVRSRFERFAITEAVIEFLDHNFSRIELALAPDFEDLRPFMWHNYHETVSENKFQLDLRYTSCVDVSTLKGMMDNFEDSDCFRAMETLRQRHIREAQKKGAKMVMMHDTSVFIAYYRDLMERQGEPVPEEKLHRMATLVNALQYQNKAAIYSVQNHLNEVVYIVVYGWDRKRAYYLFGAGHPEISEAYQGSYAHWCAFVDLANRIGVAQVDMEGVNSPKRGWFKLGFGGDLRSYYQIYKHE